MDSQQVIRHYGDNTLRTRIEDALHEANLDGDLQWSDLVPIDQFHVGSLNATRDLAAALAQAIGSDALGDILDIGCGLGGPTRFLAANYSCHVTAFDLNPPFVEVAEMLTERAGLADRIDYHVANALDLPFPAARFDNLWTQHVAMNIADRAGLYASLYRVLKPGGHLAIYDIVKGDDRPLHFPVPWASVPEISFLLTGDALRTALSNAGFVEVRFADKTDTYTSQPLAPSDPAAAEPAFGLQVAMGHTFGNAIANLRQNLAEGRVRLAQTIVRKP